jgi:hypothetical protein
MESIFGLLHDSSTKLDSNTKHGNKNHSSHLGGISASGGSRSKVFRRSDIGPIEEEEFKERVTDKHEHIVSLVDFVSPHCPSFAIKDSTYTNLGKWQGLGEEIVDTLRSA